MARRNTLWKHHNLTKKQKAANVTENLWMPVNFTSETWYPCTFFGQHGQLTIGTKNIYHSSLNGTNSGLQLSKVCSGWLFAFPRTKSEFNGHSRCDIFIPSTVVKLTTSLCGLGVAPDLFGERWRTRGPTMSRRVVPSSGRTSCVDRWINICVYTVCNKSQEYAVVNKNLTPRH